MIKNIKAEIECKRKFLSDLKGDKWLAENLKPIPGLLNLKAELARVNDLCAVEFSKTEANAAQIGKAVADAVAPLNGKIESLTKERDELARQSANVDERIHNAASMRALEIAQTQGNIPPVSFKARENPGAAAGSKNLWDQYRALPADQRNAFYKANRAAMRENN